MVVLPEPLTPMTRITCGRGKPQTSSGLATGARIFSISSARIERRPRSSRRSNFCAGNRFADSVRCFGAEIGGDQRLLDVVEGRSVERRAAGEAGQIVGDPVGGLLEPAAQAVEPAHAQTAVSWSPSRPVIRALPVSPRASTGNRDRREIVGVALAVAFDQHRLTRADHAVEPARRRRRRLLAQPRGARLHHLARQLRHACGGRVGPRREGEDVSGNDVAIVQQLQGVERHLFSFGRKAGDEVGADGRVRRERP